MRVLPYPMRLLVPRHLPRMIHPPGPENVAGLPTDQPVKIIVLLRPMSLGRWHLGCLSGSHRRAMLPSRRGLTWATWTMMLRWGPTLVLKAQVLPRRKPIHQGPRASCMATLRSDLNLSSPFLLHPRTQQNHGETPRLRFEHHSRHLNLDAGSLWNPQRQLQQ